MIIHPGPCSWSDVRWLHPFGFTLLPPKKKGSPYERDQNPKPPGPKPPIYHSGWWFQPLWKILVKIGIFPKIGVKIKNDWNHHPAISWFTPPQKKNHQNQLPLSMHLGPLKLWWPCRYGQLVLDGWSPPSTKNARCFAKPTGPKPPITL